MLKILCFNIHGGHDLRRRGDLALLHGLLERHSIDIAVLQEVETRLSRGGSLKDIDSLAGRERPHRLPALTLKEGEGWYGNLIASRYPILRGLVHDLETSPSLEPRSAVDALIDTPLGALRLIGTHLSLSPFERWSEVRNLVRLIDRVEETERKPLFLMGDINEWRPSSRLLRHLDGLMTPVPCQATFPATFPLFKLDRVWHSHGNLRVSARAIKEKPLLSDHLPLLIEISGLSA